MRPVVALLLFTLTRLLAQADRARPLSSSRGRPVRNRHRFPVVLLLSMGLFAGLALLVGLGRVDPRPRVLAAVAHEAPPEVELASATISVAEVAPEIQVEPARSVVAEEADTTPPSSHIVQPAEGSQLQEGQPLDIAVAAEDTDSRVSEVDVSLDGGRTWLPAKPEAGLPTIWHLKAGKLAAGSHRVLARARDQAGNVGVALRPVSLSVAAADRFSIQNPYTLPGTYRAAQLHDHTANSFDGDKRFTPDVKSWYLKDAGYAVVVYTDHERISESRAYSDAAFQVFPGFESTGDSGHISGWFVRQVVDYRLPAQQRINAIRQAGGIACVNHPDWSTGYSADGLIQLSGYRAIEIYNWLTTKNEGMLRDNLEKWRQVLNAKGPQDPVWGVAVGDSHGPNAVTGWTMLKVPDLSEASVRAAIENGAMYGSNGPDFESIETSGERLKVTARNAGFIRILDDTGAMVLDQQATSVEFHPSPSERWIRIEASDGAGHTAWSQPLWIVPTQPKVASLGSTSQ